MNKSKCLLMRLALIIGFIAQCALLQASTLIDGLYYDLDLSTRTATVTYEKDGTDNYASLPANVKIPKSVEYNGVSFSVTKVANKAFANCKSLESISIPCSVVQIGETDYSYKNLPFYHCTALKSVRFEDGKQGLVLGAAYSSYSCSGLFSYCPLEEVYIGRNISYQNYSGNKPSTFEEEPEVYGYSAFYNPVYGETKLTKAVISSSVTAIPKYLFYKCSALSNVDIQGQLVAIPMYSFYECKISALTLPNSVKDICEYAFNSNTAMKSAVLGNNVKSIGNYAFSGCSNLTNLDLGDSLVTIGDYAFNRSSVSSITIPNSVTKIGKYCFADNTKLEKITISNDCRELSEGIFSGCSALTSVVLNDGLEKISNKAFANCKSLESISIPSTVVQIGKTHYNVDYGSDLPFYNCTALKSVRFEDGKQRLVLGAGYYKNNGLDLFSYCPLEEAYIGRNISYQNYRNDYTFDEYPSYYGYSAFYNQPKLTKVTISPAVTGIPSYLFYKNASLTMTNLPKVKKIGVSAFQECSKLTTLNLGEDLQVVGNDAFNGCKNVTKLTFPDATTSIGSGAFQDCSSVTEVTVGKELKSIGAYAFFQCDELTSTAFSVGLQKIYNCAFTNCPKLASTTFEESSDHTLIIDESAFRNCVSLENVTFPGQLSILANYAYSGCEKLKSVIFNKNEQYKPTLTIGDYTFDKCYLIKELTFPGRLESIGNYTFASCVNLTNVSFEDANTAVKLGYGALGYSDYSERLPLFGNSNLTSLYMGRNIDYETETYVKYWYSPFYNQQYLTDIKFSQAGTVTYCKDYLLYKVNNCKTLALPESLTSIGNWTFRGMSTLESIVIPNAVTTIGTYAFADDSELGSAKLSTSCAWLKEGLFSKCGKLQAITIPTVVTKMDTQIFELCKALKNVTFEDGTDMIEIAYEHSIWAHGLFYDCPVETLYLGRWLSYNTNESCHSPFYSIAELKNLTLGKNLKVVDKYMFSYCTGLENLYIPDNITSINMWGFRGCTSLKSVRFSEALSQISDYGFSGCTSLDNVALPASMTSIADNSFSGCTSLRKLDLGTSLRIIGPSAFQNCTALEGVEMPETLEGLGVESFAGCTSLPYVEVKGEISSVGKQSFQGCTGLTWISLSKNVSSLGENSFDGCTNIKYVKSYATSPIPAGLANFPEDVVANGTLFVPASYVSRYKRSATWKDWGNIKAMTEGIFLNTVTLNQEDAHLEAGETLTLEATVGPDDAINKKVDWKSDNEAVATVSAEGVVTAHAVGQTTIHAIADDGGGAKAACTITVDPTKVASIALSSESLEIRKNHQAQLSATVAPTNATDTRIVWSSTNEDVAKVSEDGIVSAIAPGDAVIKATSQDGNQVEGTCQVKVLPVLKGDSNDDDNVNIVDVVNTINYILNKVTGKFSLEAADVNGDGSISVSDVSATTEIIMQQSLETMNSRAMAKANMDMDAPSADCLVLTQNGQKSIAVALDNNGIYTALQTDIVLPRNVSDVTFKLDDAITATHLLTYAKLNARTWRVVVYSLSNSSFLDGNAIFTVSFNKAMDANEVKILNAMASDAEAEGYRLTSRVAETTSIASTGAGAAPVQTVPGGVIIRGAVDTPVYVYTTSGILVKSFRLASEEVRLELQNGVYLVKMNGHITKTTIK